MHTDTRGTLLEEARFEDLVHTLSRMRDVEGVLSVYLDIDPATAQREGYEAQLIELWKPLKARSMDRWMRGRLEYEIAGVVEEVRSWREAPGRSVAMFFSGPAGLRIVLPLQFPLHSVARFEPRPAMAPLIAALDEHRRYCVVLFDKAQARIITALLGRVEEEVQLESDVLARTDVGGWGGYLQSRYARHREHHLTEHIHRVIEHLWAIDRSHPIHSLILGGPDEAVSALRRLLPRALARSVAGTAHLDLDLPTPEVLRRVESIDEEARQTEDVRIVEEIATEAAKGGHAAQGWTETLQSLSEGRVHLLALGETGPRGGVVCPEGHYLSTAEGTSCPFCSEPVWHTDDIGEEAVRAALLTDGQVRFLSAEVAMGLGPDGVGAILRW
jgi:peptide subunit release factor 1 (eRF1)